MLNTMMLRVQCMQWLSEDHSRGYQPTEDNVYVVSVPVWGEKFITLFAQIQMPRFAESMRRFLAKRTESRFVLQRYTDIASRSLLEELLSRSDLPALAEIVIRTGTKQNMSRSLGRQYMVAAQITSLIEARWRGRHVFPIHPNCYFEKDFFERAVALCETEGTEAVLNPAVFFPYQKHEDLARLEEGRDRLAFVEACSRQAESLASQRLMNAETVISEGKIPPELNYLFLRYDGFLAMRYLQLPPVYLSARLIQELPILHWSSYDDRFMEAVYHQFGGNRIRVVDCWETLFYTSLEVLEEERLEGRLEASHRPTEDLVGEYCNAVEAMNFCTPARALIFSQELVTSTAAFETSSELGRYTADKAVLVEITTEIARRAHKPEDVVRDYPLRVKIMQRLADRGSTAA